jgi:hypothetical protein
MIRATLPAAPAPRAVALRATPARGASLARGEAAV